MDVHRLFEEVEFVPDDACLVWSEGEFCDCGSVVGGRGVGCADCDDGVEADEIWEVGAGMVGGFQNGFWGAGTGVSEFLW